MKGGFHRLLGVRRCLGEKHRFWGITTRHQKAGEEPQQSESLVRAIPGRTLRKHRDGILGYFKNHTTSAAIVAISGLLQLAKGRARGYKTFRNFQAMA
jgi:transposase